MNIKKERERDGEAVDELGRKLSQRYHKRVVEIIKELNRSGGMVITGLVMGMGTWWYEGNDFEAIYSDDSQSTMPMKDLSDWYEKKIWQPAHWKAKHFCLFKEMEEILMYLTDTRYMGLCTLTKADLQ